MLCSATAYRKRKEQGLGVGQVRQRRGWGGRGCAALQQEPLCLRGVDTRKSIRRHKDTDWPAGGATPLKSGSAGNCLAGIPGQPNRSAPLLV